MINENTHMNYLELLESPGWEGFNYRRPENINKLGLLYTNLSLQKPALFHFFYPIFQFVIFLNCLFLGFGVLAPGVQIVFSLLLHVLLLVFFFFAKMYKNVLIFVFTVTAQILFLLVLLGFFMIYVDFTRDLTNTLGRERMGTFTIVMFLLFLLVILFIAITWIVLRYCLPQKFKTTYYNRDFADEAYLKYYKEIPQMVYKMGQKAESTDNTQIEDQRLIYPQVSKPRSLVNPPKAFTSRSDSTNKHKFVIQVTPTDTVNYNYTKNLNSNNPMTVDKGDIVEKQMEYLSDEENQGDYNPNRSRAPKTFTDLQSYGQPSNRPSMNHVERNGFFRKEEYNTRDHPGHIDVKESDAKQMNAQVNESELFHSNTYYYKAPRPETHAMESDDLKRENPETDIVNMDNFQFLGAYEVNNDTRNPQNVDAGNINIEHSKHMNYSYLGNIQQSGGVEIEGGFIPPSPNEIHKNDSAKYSGKNHVMEPDSETGSPFFTNENLTRIMGQDKGNEHPNLYPDQVIEPMQNITLKHSHFLMKERFDKAEQLK